MVAMKKRFTPKILPFPAMMSLLALQNLLVAALSIHLSNLAKLLSMNLSNVLKRFSINVSLTSLIMH